MERLWQEARGEKQEGASLIYFVDRDELNWWDYLFTEPGFRHCFILQWDEWAQRWLLADWKRRRYDLMILFDFEVEAILTKLLKAKPTVVRYIVPRETNSRISLVVQYCSNLIAKHLGFENRLILTPKQLYRRLLATGGEVVFDWRNEHDRLKLIRPDSGSKETRTKPA